MASSEVPQPWADAMSAAGIGDPRNGRPSYQGLARAAKVSAETVRQMILGTRDSDVETVDAVAAALKLDVREVSAWVRQSRSVVGDYLVPAEVALLDQDERDAITNLIRIMAKNKRPAKPARKPRLRAVPKMEDPTDFDEAAALISPQKHSRARRAEDEQP